jgi:hypothetical protein
VEASSVRVRMRGEAGNMLGRAAAASGLVAIGSVLVPDCVSYPAWPVYRGAIAA